MTHGSVTRRMAMRDGKCWAWRLSKTIETYHRTGEDGAIAELFIEGKLACFLRSSELKDMIGVLEIIDQVVPSVHSNPATEDTE